MAMNPFKADDENERGGSPFPHDDEGQEGRGGFGASGQQGGAAGDSGIKTSTLPGNPHSTRGFRRALYKSQSAESHNAGSKPGAKFGPGHGGRPPASRFAQGGGPHGMHLQGPRGFFHSTGGLGA